MNFLSTKTKTIKTYGKKRRERVISVSSLTIPVCIMVSPSNAERKKKSKRDISPATNLRNAEGEVEQRFGDVDNLENELTRRWRFAKNSPAAATKVHNGLTERNNQKSNKRSIIGESPSSARLSNDIILLHTSKGENFNKKHASSENENFGYTEEPKVTKKSKPIRDQETELFKSIDVSNVSNIFTGTSTGGLTNTPSTRLTNTLQDELDVLLNSCSQKKIYTFGEYIGVE